MESAAASPVQSNVGEPTAELRAGGITTWAPCDEVGAATHVGRSHERDEDAVEVHRVERDGDPFPVMVVCDGVASSSRGDLAAAAAARAAAQVVLSAADGQGELGDDQRAHLLRTAAHVAHEAVCEAEIDLVDGKDPSGTTLVAALIYRGRADVVWVGDSRAYLLSAPTDEAPVDICLLLTHDHSWVNLVVDRGEMTEEEAEAAPLAHAITRCIGPVESPDPARPAEPGHSHAVVPPGSRVILCSDGVSNYGSSPADFTQLVGSVTGWTTAGDLASGLVGAALRLGGDDDMTAAVAILP
ncbi:MAG: protein phosphatase 2C domain-containing protein [Acidimicrobiales bacterium]